MLSLRIIGTKTPVASPSKPKHNYIDLITQKHKTVLQAQSKGIDYHFTHVKTSGVSEKTFDSNVKDLIHDFSAGVPRQINAIATACLVAASWKQTQVVTQDVFNQALDEFKSF